MKKFFLAVAFLFATGAVVNAQSTSDSSVTKKVAVLEKKIAAQEKEIKALKEENARQNKETATKVGTSRKYVVSRKSSKQVVAVD